MTVSDDLCFRVLDKITLNNEIVTMRHSVRCSRVHTINKLVRTARALKVKKGSDEQKEKNTTKADKLMYQVKIIKTLSDDDVSKFCLTNTKSPLIILNKIGGPMKRKALARLSMHQSMVRRIANFHLRFPDWKQSVPRVLQMIASGHKTDSSKQKVKEGKKKISQMMADVGSEPKVELKKNIKKQISGEIQLNTVGEPKEKQKNKKNSIIQLKTSCNVANILAPVEVSKEVDPFFVTKDDKEFITTMGSHSIDEFKNTHDARSLKPRLNEDFKEETKPFKKKGTKPFGSANNRRGNRFCGTKLEPQRVVKMTDFVSKKAMRREVISAEPFTDVNTKLHPSWEAKKKQSSIVAYQGKKLYFGD